MGMRSMDVPPPDPESFGAPEGRARPPSELLDNLRLRLGRLAENHPSAPRHPDAGRGPHEPPRRHPGRAEADGQTAADDQTIADGQTIADDQAEADRLDEADERVGADDDGRSGPLADATGAARLTDGPLGLPADSGALAEMSLPGMLGESEAYRPWFMAGEPGSPWWAAADDLGG